MQMDNFLNKFSSPKPIIGMIHLPALPGSASGKHARFSELAKFVLKELDSLQKGGVDGVIVENFWDLPYLPERVPPVTVAAVAALAGLVVEKASIPVGVNILYNDYEAEISVARAINAAFIRAEVFVDPALSETGMIPASAPHLLRLRAALQAENTAILADIHGKNTHVLWERDITESAVDAESRGLADAIVVTGAGTGKSVSPDDLRQVKAVISLPLIAGSGVKPASLADFLKVCDGAIVGSFFKTDGRIEAPTDPERVRELMSVVKKS